MGYKPAWGRGQENVFLQIFRALGPMDSWAPKLTGDIEMMFFQPKTPTKRSEISS